MRWAIAAKIRGTTGCAGADGRVAAEAARDPSDRGQRAKLRCEVSAPDPAVKAAALGAVPRRRLRLAATSRRRR